MKLIVIYDPDAEIAATIDADNMLAWGPVAPGAHGAELLHEWLNGSPYDYGGASPELLQSIFAQHLANTGQLPPGPPEGAPEPPGAPPAPSEADQAAIAQKVAQEAGDPPPPPQPADQDQPGTPGPTPTTLPDPGTADAPGEGPAVTEGEPPAAPSPGAAVATEAPAPPPATQPIACPNCNGAGTITHQGEDGPVTNPCGMCGGSGQVRVGA